MTADRQFVYGVDRKLRGHDLIEDPPVAMTSMRRATCRTCGCAVIVRPNGSTYGSAVERDCQAGGQA